MLQRLHQAEVAIARIYLVWVDGSYSGFKFLQWTMDTLGCIVQVVLRPQEAKGFALVKKRLCRFQSVLLKIGKHMFSENFFYLW